MQPLLAYPIAITIGAVPGALSRHYITELTKATLGTKFPYGTFLINLTGCLLLGFFSTLSTTIEGYPKELDLLIRTGFCGTYTTFSTYGWDTLSLWRKKDRRLTVFYWLGSAILGLGAIYLGIFIAKLLIR